MKNLSYYQKLGFEDPFSWNKEDFSDFLVWDQIKAYKSMKDLEPGMLETAKNSMQKYNKYKLILNFYDSFFQKLCFKNSKKGRKILFQGTTFSKIISEAKKFYSLGLITQTKEDRLFSFKNFIGYLNINDLHQYIYYYLKEKNISYLYQIVENLEGKLKALKPNYIVLLSDICSIEKNAIILVCKKLGIITLEIQLGMLQSSLFSTGAGAGKVDYFLVWGQHFKDLYVKAKVTTPEKIYVLGYPYDSIVQSRAKLKVKKNKKCAVYYLGHPFEELDHKGLLEMRIKTLVELNRMCEKLNIEFFYRPHPREKRDFLKSKVSDVNFTPKDEALFDTIAKGDIFISFDSTSFIEASMRSKLSLQLINFPIPTDNLEKLGACAKSFYNIEKLSAYLQTIIKRNRVPSAEGTEGTRFLPEFQFNNNYVETRYNPGERFVEILNQIHPVKSSEAGISPSAKLFNWVNL